jgi:hypothetical protein
MMRKIDRYNYEEFFLDYLEGNLSDSDVKKLKNFLSHHPDLKKELDEMHLVELEEEIFWFDKSSLKQIPFESDFEEFCVAKLERDLEKEEEIAFNNYLNENLIGKAQYQLYEKTKLKADIDIIYPDKEGLKRKERKLIPYWLLSGVGLAASVLILFSVWNTFIIKKESSQISGNKFSDNDSVKKVLIEPNNNKDNLEQLVSSKAEIKVTNTELNASSKKQDENLIAESESIVNTTEKTLINNTLADNESEKNEIEPEKISLPEVVKTSELKTLANSEVIEQKMKMPNQQEELNNTPVNSGLTNLGMSWKSSVKKKKKSNSLLYAVAKMGVDKLGAIAGKKVQLEKQYDSETEKTSLKFNTKGLGFSTSIK